VFKLFWPASLHKKIADRVEKDEPLYTIHAEFNADFNFARQASAANNAYRIETQQ